MAFADTYCISCGKLRSAIAGCDCPTYEELRAELEAVKAELEAWQEAAEYATRGTFGYTYSNGEFKRLIDRARKLSEGKEK